MIFALLLSLAANAAPSHYFYSIAETDSPDWDYVFPKCQKLSGAEYEKIQGECTRINSISEKCATEKTVNLKKVAASSAKAVPAAAATDAGGSTAPKATSATGASGSSATPAAVASPVPAADKDVQKVDETTKTFKVSYMVFVSEKQCRETREAAMKPITK